MLSESILLRRQNPTKILPSSLLSICIFLSYLQALYSYDGLQFCSKLLHFHHSAVPNSVTAKFASKESFRGCVRP